MTYALSLFLWMATAQTADKPAPAVVQHIPSERERALRAQLDEARAQLDEARDRLAKVEAESGLADNAVAALLLSDHPELAALRPVNSRYVHSDYRRAWIDVFASTGGEKTMVAVVVKLKNPRDQATWQPTEAWVSVPSGPTTFIAAGHFPPWFPPKPVAVRSAPQHVVPGQSARIVVVFDKTDLEFAYGPVRVGLQRDGKTEFQFELWPSEVQPTLETGDS